MLASGERLEREKAARVCRVENISVNVNSELRGAVPPGCVEYPPTPLGFGAPVLSPRLPLPGTWEPFFDGNDESDGLSGTQGVMKAADARRVGVVVGLYFRDMTEGG